jgi:F0F1-type ATP synthase epsilon subunit
MLARQFARNFTKSNVRMISSSSIKRAEAATAVSSDLILNFCAPHEPVYADKVVESVIIPGADGEYGVTAGISPIISELQPGVVQVIHKGGDVEKFFVSGGFAISHDNNVTDISVSEAFPLSDFDEGAIKSNYQAAQSAASSGDDYEKAKAAIEISTLQNLARAIGMTL